MLTLGFAVCQVGFAGDAVVLFSAGGNEVRKKGSGWPFERVLAGLKVLLELFTDFMRYV